MDVSVLKSGEVNKKRAPACRNRFGPRRSLAHEYGVNRTARALRLDYSGLKKRMESSVSGDRSQAVAGPQFIQLLGSELTAVAECAIECRHANGAMIRIHLKGPQLPDLAALTRSLWNGDR